MEYNHERASLWEVFFWATGLGLRCTVAAHAAERLVTPSPDGTIVCEAEEFAVEKPGWQAKPWGENYYAATFANTFLSRKAFLGAAENGDETVAAIAIEVKEPGKYLVLVRYEAAYRFETQFRVKVEQAGRVRLDRLYGARDNLKIWPFGKRLQKEVAWPWARWRTSSGKGTTPTPSWKRDRPRSRSSPAGSRPPRRDAMSIW